MKLHHLLLLVPNSILFSVQEHCFTSCDQCGTVHSSCVRAKNNAATFLMFPSCFVRIYFCVFPLGAFVHGNLVFLCLPWHIVPFFNPACPFHSLDPVEIWYLLPYSLRPASKHCFFGIAKKMPIANLLLHQMPTNIPTPRMCMCVKWKTLDIFCYPFYPVFTLILIIMAQGNHDFIKNYNFII